MTTQTRFETTETIIDGKRNEITDTIIHNVELLLSEDGVHGQIAWDYDSEYYQTGESNTITFMLDATNRIDEITYGPDAFDELEAIPEAQAWLREQGLRMPADDVDPPVSYAFQIGETVQITANVPVEALRLREAVVTNRRKRGGYEQYELEGVILPGIPESDPSWIDGYWLQSVIEPSTDVYPVRTIGGRTQVRDTEGVWRDAKSYQESLRVYPTPAWKEMTDGGTPFLGNIVSAAIECECGIVGCGTLQFPVTIQFCEKHKTVEVKEAQETKPEPIQSVVFPDPEKFIHDEVLTFDVDNVSACYPNGGFSNNGLLTIEDQHEGKSKLVTITGLVTALKQLCELIDGQKLFVGELKSAQELADPCNWDAEVVDAFWQLAYHGEVIYG